MFMDKETLCVNGTVAGLGAALWIYIRHHAACKARSGVFLVT